MPKTKFPEFKGKSEKQIMADLKAACTDRSFHSNYSIGYTIFTPPNPQYKKLNFSGLQEYFHKAKVKEQSATRDACFGSLPGMIRRFRRNYEQEPQMFAVTFNLQPFDSGIDDYDDYYEDDYSDDYTPTDEMDDLTNYEVREYSKWLIKHAIVPDFDIDHFIREEIAFFPFGYWHNVNDIYFSLTMHRYMHEGQNICRRILELDERYDLDPFVNIVLAHWLSDSHYNSGHCACDVSYWRDERYYDMDRYDPDFSDNRGCAQLYMARIANAMSAFLKSGYDDSHEYDLKTQYGSNPYFEWEFSVAEHERKLKMDHPRTWRGLLRHKTS
jgi:hypothetical protein